MGHKPIVKHLEELSKYSIASNQEGLLQNDVRQIFLTGPEDGSTTSVFYEVWDPQSEQPDNEHDDSVEIFLFLSGHGHAKCDEFETDVKAGDILILPAGSVHRIRNTSDDERMYAVTVMANDPGSMPGGFAKLVTDGIAAPVDEIDLNTILSTPIKLES